MIFQSYKQWMLPTTKERQQVCLIAAAALLIFTACGINFSFGVYQAHYETLHGPFQGASAGEISLIGTLASSIMMLGAPLANGSIKRYGAGATVAASGVLFAISGVMAATGNKLWHFHLWQGGIQGCAACLAYIPAVTITPQVFTARRGLAMGIVTSGTGLGGVVWAPILNFLLKRIGFRFTLGFVGLLSAVLILGAASAFDYSYQLFPEPNNAHRNCIDDMSARTERAADSVSHSRAVLAHTLASALQSAAYFAPLYFMSSFATSMAFSETAGANIIALCNLSNFMGKILVGYVADHLGTINMLFVATTTSAVVSLGIAGAAGAPISILARRELLIMYAVFYGASAGAYVALLPNALVEHFGISGIAKINGRVYLFRGCGSLIGTWIAGSLAGVRGEKIHEPVEFVFTYLFVGTSLSAAAGLILWTRHMGLRNVK